MESRNPQAFPTYERGAGATPLDLSCPGMSLRDYFAAKVIQGLIARPGGINTKQDAEFAYMVADAMLAARSTPTKDTP